MFNYIEAVNCSLFACSTCASSILVLVQVYMYAYNVCKGCGLLFACSPQPLAVYIEHTCTCTHVHGNGEVSISKWSTPWTTRDINPMYATYSQRRDQKFTKRNWWV